MFLNREGLSDARVVLITQKVRFCSTIFVIIHKAFETDMDEWLCGC